MSKTHFQIADAAGDRFDISITDTRVYIEGDPIMELTHLGWRALAWKMREGIQEASRAAPECLPGTLVRLAAEADVRIEYAPGMPDEVIAVGTYGHIQYLAEGNVGVLWYVPGKASLTCVEVLPHELELVRE